MNQRTDPRTRVGIAALQLYAEHGVAATTVEEAFTEAGVLAAEVHPPIEDTQDLLAAAYTIYQHQHTELLLQCFAETPDVGAAFDLFFVKFIERLREGHDIEYQRMMIQLWNAALSNHRVEALMREQLVSPRALLIKNLERGQRSGHVRKDLSAPALFDYFFAVWNGLIIQAQMDPNFDAIEMLEVGRLVCRKGVFLDSESSE